MKKTVLFDLDGTLTDSGEGIINCAIPALEHFGLPIPSREEMRVFVGPPLHETFQRFGVPADKTEEAIRVYRSRYIPTGMFENTPYPGIKELLETLKGKGHKLFVATSKPEPFAEEILTHFGLRGRFACVCGSTLDESRTRKEEVIAYALGRLGAPPDETVMVGDRCYDVTGAAKCGLPCIGVLYGYGSRDELCAAGAAALADTPRRLAALLTGEKEKS